LKEKKDLSGCDWWKFSLLWAERKLCRRVIVPLDGSKPMNRRTFLTAAGSVPLAAALARPLAHSLDRKHNSHSFTASMWSYLWDLADEGYGSALNRMKDNGLTCVSLACAYHAGKFLAPHNPKRKVVFLEDGTVYFTPTLSKYGRIKPRINTLVREGHSLAVVKREADKAAMETRAWVVCCHNTPLGMHYPDAACRTAHGDPLYHNLCPSNGDVRAYLRAVVSDIASHGASVIELEAMQFQGYTHGFHHEREGIALPQSVRFLLGLCFCDSCGRRFTPGQSRFEETRKFVRHTLDTYFRDPKAAARDVPAFESLAEGPLGELMEWRRSVVTSLAEELTQAVSRSEARLRPLVSYDATARAMVAMDPQAVAAITGGVLMPGYTKDGASLRPLIADLQALVQGQEIIVGFQVGLPGSGGRGEFLSRVAAARGLGISSFNFYNYGFIPYDNLAWIREALEA
jgi:hypothetical protein